MSSIKTIRDGVEWSDDVGSIAVEIKGDLSRRLHVIMAGKSRRELLSADEVQRADSLLNDLRQYRADNMGAFGPMVIQLEDGRLEGGDGTLSEGFLSEFPHLMSSEGWGARDALVTGRQPVLLGAGFVELHEGNRVGWSGRLLIRWPVLETIRMLGGGRTIMLTGVLAIVTRVWSTLGTEGQHDLLEPDRSLELSDHAYCASTFMVKQGDEDPVGGSPEVPQAVLTATSTLSSPEDLELLAGDARWIVRAAVATNPVTPGHVAAALLEDRSAGVRTALALNPSASAHTRAALAHDSEVIVRITDAWTNDNSPELVDVFARDADWMVRFACADNPCTPEEGLERAAADEAWQVRMAAAARVDLPMPTFQRLANDEEPMVLMAVAANQLCPASLLDHFLSSDNQALREVVEGRRSNRHAFEEHLRQLPRFGRGATDASPYA